MTRILFLLLVLASPATLIAQRETLRAERQSMNQKDAEADRVLRSAKVKMNGLNDFTATFTYELDNRAAKTKTVAKRGVVKFKRNKYRIDFQDQSVISDGSTVWNYLVAEKEVNVTANDPSQGFSFDRIFRIYNDDMKASYDRADKIRGVQTDKVSLFPNSSRSEYFKVEMWVARATALPVRMKVYARNGSVITYDLSDMRTNSNISDTEFVWIQANHPGVEVVDLR